MARAAAICAGELFAIDESALEVVLEVLSDVDGDDVDKRTRGLSVTYEEELLGDPSRKLALSV
jgi:hypothetical protein